MTLSKITLPHAIYPLKRSFKNKMNNNPLTYLEMQVDKTGFLFSFLISPHPASKLNNCQFYFLSFFLTCQEEKGQK